MHHHTDLAFHECIELCWSCRDTCQSMLFNHCLIEGGPHLAPDHVRLMADCVQICQTSADFMTRNSAMHAHTCAACAKVCDACAESCEALGDEDMRRCAEMCRRCADSCRLMSGSH